MKKSALMGMLGMAMMYEDLSKMDISDETSIIPKPSRGIGGVKKPSLTPQQQKAKIKARKKRKLNRKNRK